MNQESLVGQIRAVGGLRCEDGENLLKYFKKGWNRKEGRGNKDFKRGGGKLGQEVDALKKGAGTPLRTMVSVKKFILQPKT